MKKRKVGRPKQQFCKRGHDTFLLNARDKHGVCRKCYRETHPLKLGGQRKQFCPNGHDTFICGRYEKGGRCKKCVYDPRFCKKGHDKDIVGRVGKANRCKLCVSKRKKKLFCVHGHKLSIMGRLKRGACLACRFVENPQPRGRKAGKFCKNGHERSKFGIENGSRCGKCRAIELRENNFRRKYSITMEMHDQLLGEQDFKCAICGIDERVDGRRLVVDHNHKTNALRSLLCISCNWMLGHSRESIEILQKAEEYLKNYEKQTSL